MAKNKYRPDYAALYPGVEISAEVMDMLRKSDRKMKYMEQDLKTERPIKTKAGIHPRALPAREDSYDRLLESDQEFSGGEVTPEQHFVKTADEEMLHRCLGQLEEVERTLIQHLFFYGLTEREYAKVIGISQQAVNKRKGKILAKLEALINS